MTETDRDRGNVRSRSLRSLLTQPEPFASVYLADARTTTDRREWNDITWRHVSETLSADDVDARVADALEPVIRYGEPTASVGRGLIATVAGLLVDVPLPVAPAATLVRVSSRPYLLPLLGCDSQQRDFVFASVDRLGADVFVRHGTSGYTETFVGGGYPVHEPATAGWNGYDDRRGSVAEAIRVNVRAIADRVTELVELTSAGTVFVSGAVRSRTDVISALPQRISQQVVALPGAAKGRRHRLEEVTDVVETVLRQRCEDEKQRLIDRFAGQRGRSGGLATEGLSAVCSALREGNVDELLVGDLGDAAVLAGTSAAAVRPASADAQTSSAEHIVRADEAVPFAALATNARITTVTLDLDEGVGALLRHPAT